MIALTDIFDREVFLSNTSHKLKVDRFLRRKQRKALKRQRRSKKRKHNKNGLASGYSSRVITCLNNAAFAFPNDRHDSIVNFKIPKIFCLSREPNASILFLRKLYGAIMDPEVRSIHFDHTKCEVLGVCASTVMDVILVEGEKWRKSINNPIMYGGVLLPRNRLSENPEVDKLLKISGIWEHLGIKHESYDEIEALKLQKDGESSEIAENVIEYINRSLHRHGLMLTNRGNNYFGKLLGEIADNCYQHGGPNATWYTLGHYSYDRESASGKCQLVILDFGRTIYEGLKMDATVSMQERIKHYVRHTRSWFQTQESEETLYTLFSLQQRASRFAAKNDSVRGNGTVVFIDAFQRLFAGNSKDRKSLLSITSGKCSILFDGTYLLNEVTYSSQYKNKIIAFNKENDLKKPPDHRYVRSINNGFPGTIISMELHINNSLISRKEE